MRQKRSAEALKELAEAGRLAPDTPRFAYVHAVALNDAGQKRQAIRALEAALARHPNEREVLLGLVLFLRDAGEDKRAATYARRLAELEPDNRQVQRLVGQSDGVGR
ncbi:MAG: tetratricopeptide repeat protein [Comamonadaceae bacterium]|nr:tetratricopeptide repeat protein [Comamonadaceae bacterium]